MVEEMEITGLGPLKFLTEIDLFGPFTIPHIGLMVGFGILIGGIIYVYCKNRTDNNKALK